MKRKQQALNFNTKDGTTYNLNRAARRAAKKLGVDAKDVYQGPIRKATDGNYYRNGDEYRIQSQTQHAEEKEVVIGMATPEVIAHRKKAFWRVAKANLKAFLRTVLYKFFRIRAF